MSDSVIVRVPLDARYRALAPELAAKFAELIGGTAADARAVAETLAAELDRMASRAGDAAEVELAFRGGRGGVEIAMRCGAHSGVVKQPLPARKT